MTSEWLQDNWGVVVLLASWELVWKGIALWRASKDDSKAWFVTLLVINTVGLLPIAYLFFLRTKTDKESTDETKQVVGNKASRR